ncbi:MAG: hypothetical protein ACFFDF_03540, partial [Candidatus Odinarchaeota archaeon]
FETPLTCLLYIWLVTVRKQTFSALVPMQLCANHTKQTKTRFQCKIQHKQNLTSLLAYPIKIYFQFISKIISDFTH